MQGFRTTAIAIVGLAGVALCNEIFIQFKAPEIVEEENGPVKQRKTERSPASVSPPTPKIATPAQDLQVTSSSSNDSTFNQNAEPSSEPPAAEASSSEGGGFDGGGGFQSSSNEGSNSPRNNSNSNSDSKSKSSTPSNAKTASITPSNITGVVLPNPVLPPPPVTQTPIPEDELSCSANVGGGTYGNPIQVTLSCTAASEIKYCVQADTCCDPETSGTAYTIPVVIGANDGTICLSFYGETASNKISTVVEKSYTINNTYPDLQLSFPKISYQTTQLAGFHYLRSNDFSKSNYSVGEINLKSHDPGPSGRNIDCEEIVETYVTFVAPVPALVFNPLDMFGITFGNQLNVPLVLSNLDYGDNYLTSYAVNNNFAAPLYSCSTNKVTLNDFEYFAPEASHGDVGTNASREFAGSFVAYGFFEEDAVVHRGPAGNASENDSGQELRVGSFGIFY